MRVIPVQFLGWEDLLEKGQSYPLQYSGLENSLDCLVHGVAKSHFLFLEEEMATRYSILAWRIPWTEEPGGLQSTGSQGVKTRLSD